MKILYIQHAADLGGSCTSLLYTAQGMRDFGESVVIALARPSVRLKEYYRAAGIDVVDLPGLSVVNHSTVARRRWSDPLTYSEYLKAIIGWRYSARILSKMLDSERPDIVHLNSMPLYPSASALSAAGFPFVWHVREPPPDQSWRTKLISRAMRKANDVIFLSKFDQMQWVGGDIGTVLQNFVDDRSFENSPALRTLARNELSLADAEFVVLFLGGVSNAKGFSVLISALSLLATLVPKVVCLAPGTAVGRAGSLIGRVLRFVPSVGGLFSPVLAAQKELVRSGASSLVRSLEFVVDVKRLYAAADVVVFPAVLPHFARPAIEGAAMGLPVIASDLGGMRETVHDGVTGILVRPGDPGHLMSALRFLACNPERRHAMGNAGRRLARECFSQKTQIEKLRNVYGATLCNAHVKRYRGNRRSDAS
jgi:glycosyltransferase involved in cell wall biosynthesis